MTHNPKEVEVTARVVLKGAMLLCVNRLDWCELGLVVCPDHPKRIEIRKNTGGTPSLHDLEWPEGHDLLFNVKESRDKGVKPDPKATGDFGFSHVLDLEGERFHDDQVVILKRPLDGRRVGITAGRLYTHELTEDELLLMKWFKHGEKGKLVDELGTVAQQVGINIRCREVEGAGIDIVDVSTGRVIESLPVAENTWYEIEINNDCSEEDEENGPKTDEEKPVGSDFRFFYDVVVPPSAEKFDLEKKEKQKPTFPFPGVCEVVNLSETDSLGLT